MDSTGLYYYNARYYDPGIGRFVSADILVKNPANPQTLNRYTYASSNPLVYVDPTGHFDWKTFGIITAVTVVVVGAIVVTGGVVAIVGGGLAVGEIGAGGIGIATGIHSLSVVAATTGMLGVGAVTVGVVGEGIAYNAARDDNGSGSTSSAVMNSPSNDVGSIKAARAGSVVMTRVNSDTGSAPGEGDSASLPLDTSDVVSTDPPAPAGPPTPAASAVGGHEVTEDSNSIGAGSLPVGGHEVTEPITYSSDSQADVSSSSNTWADDGGINYDAF